MPLTKASFAVIQVANNVTSTTVGNTTSIPSFTFDQNGVITSASNTAISGAGITANTIANSAFQTGAVESYMRAVNLDFGLRNRIINGDMRIDQRNAGAAVTGNDNVYGVDRFRVQVTQSAKMNLQQDSSANTVAGFTSSLKVTSSSAYSVTNSDYFFLQQRIEGNNVADLRFGTANARPVTLSFWVRSSLTGTFGGSLQNDDQNRNYPFTYTINSANTWEYETITVPGDTSGTWLTNNGTGLRVNFGLGVGSNFSGTAGAWNANSNNLSATGAVSVVGTNGATWYITGVQLEEGSVPTPFEYRHFGTELHLCQRYYKRISRVDSSGGDNGFINFADWDSLNAYGGNIISPSMRSAPSLSYSALSDFAYYEGGSIKTPTGITIVGSGPNYVEISIGWSGGLTTGRAGWMRINGASGWIAFSSEI